MKTEWLDQAIVQMYIPGGLLIGLIGTLTLWISTRMEMRAIRKAFEAFRLSTETTIGELSAKIEESRSATPPEQALAAASMTVRGLNMTTRANVLRMHRRGEAIPSIAAALGVQQEEVQLLLKLDQLLARLAA